MPGNCSTKCPRETVVCRNAMISRFAMDGKRGEDRSNEIIPRNAKCWDPSGRYYPHFFVNRSCSGMASEGLKLLGVMCNTYNIQPKGEHYGCLIHLLSKEGLLEEARNMVQSAPTEDEAVVAWRASLSGCVDHGEVSLAEVAAEKIFRSERHSGVYVLLSNLYSAAGKHDGAIMVRKTMRKKELIEKKSPGCSSVEINGVVLEFVAGEK